MTTNGKQQQLEMSASDNAEFDESSELEVPEEAEVLPDESGHILFDTEVGCNFLRYLRNEAETFDHQQRYHAMSILACLEEPREAVHEFLSGFEGFDPEQAEKQVEEARSSKYGPSTCDRIRQDFGPQCAGCPHNVKSPAVLLQPRFEKLLEAKNMALQAIVAVEGGDKSAHLAPDSIQAFAVVKSLLLPKFVDFRERLKTAKAPLADFDKAIGRQAKDAPSAAATPPAEAIYQPIIEAFEGSEFHLNEAGRLCTSDSEGAESVVSNFLVRPVKEILRDNGLTTDRSYIVEGIGEGGKILGTAVISDADLFSMRFPSVQWGLKARIMTGANNAALLRDSIFVLGAEAEQETIYTHSGFRQIDGKWQYLHGDGSIGGESAKVELPQPLDQCRLPEPPADPVPSIRQGLQLLAIAPYSVMIPLMSAVFLAPLCEAARRAKIEPAFVLWLCGKTGSRKTTLAKLMLHFFGPFEILPASFKDTANAMAHKAFVAKDIPLLIDDFHPAGSRREAQTMIGAASHLLRIYGDRIGRGRLNSCIELQASVPPRGVGIITAEELPPGGASDVARAFVCAVKPDDVDLEALSAAQAAQDALAACMSAYVSWLLPQMEALPEELSENFMLLREYYQGLSSHGRTGEAAAWLHSAWRQFVRFAEESGAISAEDAAEYDGAASVVFAELVEEQDRMVREHQPVDVFLETVSALLAAQKISLRKLGENITWRGMPGPDFVGYADDDFYYFHAELIYNTVNQFLKKHDERIDIAPKTLWEQLADEGHVEAEIEYEGTDRERRMFLKKKTIETGKPRPRLLWVRRSSVDPVDE